MSKYAGTTYCNNCKQLVDTESEDNITFSCVQCDKVFDKKGNDFIIKDVWKIKSTPENLAKVFSIIEEQYVDFNGRGELDEDTGIMRCVEWAIEQLIECKEL